MRCWRERGRRPAPGFTVVELLVSLAVIAAVLVMVAVAAGEAVRRSRRAACEALLEAVAMGFVRFRADTGYLPPVLADPGLMPDGSLGAPQGTLGWSRDAVEAPVLPPADDPASGPVHSAWGPTELLSVQAWCSTTTPAEYLLGPGDRSQDGFGVILGEGGALPAGAEAPGGREQPQEGIRHPGIDGVWGAWTNPRPGMRPDGRFRSRCLAAFVSDSLQGDPLEGNANGQSQRQDPSRLRGPRLGPYLDLASGLDVGGLVAIGPGGVPIVARPGDRAWHDSLSRVIIDPFGLPVLYYRRPHFRGNPRSLDRRFSLADVVPIRPARFGPGEAIDAAPDAAGDRSASGSAATAGLAVFSFGPDRAWNPLVRADPDGRNEDNIVRLER
jgi:type II secretory pathway pseudopilin PulG